MGAKRLGRLEVVTARAVPQIIAERRDNRVLRLGCRAGAVLLPALLPVAPSARREPAHARRLELLFAPLRMVAAAARPRPRRAGVHRAWVSAGRVRARGATARGVCCARFWLASPELRTVRGLRNCVWYRYCTYLWHSTSVLGVLRKWGLLICFGYNFCQLFESKYKNKLF